MRFVNPEDKTKSYIMPMELLVASKYKAKPDSRTELLATRDGNNNLLRVTSPNHKTKIEFYTKPEMTQTEKESWEEAAKVGLINADQRKYYVEFFNNSMGVNEYQFGEFYFADIDYVSTKTTSNEIQYASTRYSLTQY